MKTIVHESYTDILKNERLSNYVISRARNKDKPVDLNRLDGVGPDQLRVLNQVGF